MNSQNLQNCRARPLPLASQLLEDVRLNFHSSSRAFTSRRLMILFFSFRTGARTLSRAKLQRRFDQRTLGSTPLSLMDVDEICDELFYIKSFYSAGDGLRGQG